MIFNIRPNRFPCHSESSACHPERSEGSLDPSDASRPQDDRRRYLFIWMILLGTSFCAASADVRISEPNLVAGKVEQTKGNVTIIDTSGATRKAAKDSTLLVSEKIVTKKGYFRVRLRDDSVFELGQRSSGSVKELLLESKKATAKLELEITEGYFKFASGRIGEEHPNGVKIYFPVGFVLPRNSVLLGKITETNTLVIHWPPDEVPNRYISLANQTDKGFIASSIREKEYAGLISGKEKKPSFPFKIDAKEFGLILDKLNPGQILESTLGVAEESEEDSEIAAPKS